MILYLSYTKEMQLGNAMAAAAVERAIKQEWNALNRRFEAKSLYEVLRDNGWITTPAYSSFDANPACPTIEQLFGPVSGGYQVFLWTSFMEALRIQLHADETDQSTFVGAPATCCLRS